MESCHVSKKLHSRKSERVKPLKTVPVEVQVISVGAIDILRAFDISVKGIGVKTPHHYELEFNEGRVELVITLPGYRPFQALGLVRHVTQDVKAEKCVGVEFVNIADQNRSAIVRYMESVKEAYFAAAS